MQWIFLWKVNPVRSREVKGFGFYIFLTRKKHIFIKLCKFYYLITLIASSWWRGWLSQYWFSNERKWWISLKSILYNRYEYSEYFPHSLYYHSFKRLKLMNVGYLKPARNDTAIRPIYATKQSALPVWAMIRYYGSKNIETSSWFKFYSEI